MMKLTNYLALLLLYIIKIFKKIFIKNFFKNFLKKFFKKFFLKNFFCAARRKNSHAQNFCARKIFRLRKILALSLATVPLRESAQARAEKF